MTLRRSSLVALLAAAAIVLTAGRAGAQVVPDPGEVDPGAEVTATFTATEGCDASPTVRMDITVPEGVTDAATVEKDGWQASVDDGVVVYEWGGVAGDESGEFVITFTAPDDAGSVLLFPTIQSCVQGAISWVEEETDADRPAPRIVISGGDVTPTTQPGDEAPAPNDPDAPDDVEPGDPSATTAPATAGSDDGSTDDGGAPGLLFGIGVIVISAGGVATAVWMKRRQDG